MDVLARMTGGARESGSGLDTRRSAAGGQQGSAAVTTEAGWARGRGVGGVGWQAGAVRMLGPAAVL